MLTAGDEFGRRQRGNNNAYAQDNAISWIDWAGRDLELEAFTAELAEIRSELSVFAETAALTGTTGEAGDLTDVEWLDEDGRALDESSWNEPARQRLAMVLADRRRRRVAVAINGDRRASSFAIPTRAGWCWQSMQSSTVATAEGAPILTGRSCGCFIETLVG